MLELPADPAQIPDIIVYLVSMWRNDQFTDAFVAASAPHWAPAHGALRREGDEMSKTFLCNIWKKQKKVLSSQMLEVPRLGVGTAPHLEKDAWSMVKRLGLATSEHASLTALHEAVI